MLPAYTPGPLFAGLNASVLVWGTFALAEGKPSMLVVLQMLGGQRSAGLSHWPILGFPRS